MKIKSVQANNHKHAFIVTTCNGQEFVFPYSQLNVMPHGSNRICQVEVDSELGKEAFSYELESGECDTVHIDHVLHFVNEPEYVRELARHKLSMAAKRLIGECGVGKKEILRRLKTSPSQLSRLIDPSNSRTSIDKLLMLLVACDCKVDLTVDGESILQELHEEESEPAWAIPR
jgi:predicted XRE-type DNA-binding protein